MPFRREEWCSTNRSELLSQIVHEEGAELNITLIDVVIFEEFDMALKFGGENIDGF